jgi:membrane dipeptidase
LAYYRALERDGHIRVLTDGTGLQAHVAEWQAWEASGDEAATPPLGFVISMEGADPIRDPGQLAAWYEAGLRLLGPTHYGPGRYAGGTGNRGFARDAAGAGGCVICYPIGAFDGAHSSAH